MPKTRTPSTAPARRAPLKRVRIGAASISLQHAGAAFIVCVNRADGTKSRQRCANEATAKTVFDLRVREAERQGVNVAASLRDEDRHAVADFYQRTALWGTKPTVAAALAEYIERHEKQSASLTFSEALTRRLDEARARGTTERHIINVKSRVKTFLAKFGETPIGDLTHDQISAFIAAMPVSPRSRADTLNDVSSVLAAAVRAGKLDRNPAALVRPPKTDAPETGVIEAADLARLLTALPERSVAAVAVMAFAGLRRSEAEQLEWANVRLGENVLIVTAGTSKTGARRTVPISPTLHRWLAPRKKDEGAVAPASMTFRRDLEESRERAKITEWPRNALRHTAASVWVALEQDIGRVAAWLGHDPKVLHRHYKNLLTPAQAQAWLEVVPPPAPKQARPRKAAAKPKSA